MTVISRLFRKEPNAPDAQDAQPSTPASRRPGEAGGSAPGAGVEAARISSIETQGAGDALYACAGLTGAAEAGNATQRAAQRRLAGLIDSGAVTFAQIPGRQDHLHALLAVAALCTDQSLLAQSMAAIVDEELLGRLAIEGTAPAIRQLAAERVQDLATLLRLLKDARGKDKNVYRILKQKRDAIHAQRRAAEEELASMTTLCTTIERHIPQPFNSTYIAVIEHLTAQWALHAAQAPAELQARFETAVTRSRQVIAQHQEHIAEVAARAAAIDGVATQRETLLNALRTLLADLYAGRALDAADTLTALRAQWLELDALKAPDADASAHFLALGTAVESLSVFNEHHSSVAQRAAALTGQHVRALRDALGHAALLGERAPSEVQEAGAVLRAWEQARADDQAAAATALRQVTGLLRKAQSTLAAGNSRQAAGLRRAVEDKLHALASVPPQLASQLQAFDAELGVLQDWRSFVVAPKRTELIEQMAALIETDEAPPALAVRIKRLQDEWKLISKGGTEDTQAEWQRFHDAAQKAYEPCRLYFAAQAAQRAANLERRAALLTRLQAFVAAQNWEQTDWREVARALRESAQQWRNSQPVERAANRPMQESFEALCTDLQARLNAEYTRNAEAKQALITRAQRLVGMEDGRQATDEVKRLQLAWQSIGLVAHEQSQRLWEDFRQQCDAVFAQRQQQHGAYIDSLETHRAQAESLCADAEKLLTLSGAELIDGAKQVTPLRDAFAALGELPMASARGLQRRFENALDQCQRKLVQMRAQEKQQAWEQVFAAADGVRRFRLSVAEGAAPEIAEARRQEAQAYIEAAAQWPKGTLAALQAALATPGSSDLAANEVALRTLCIRAELLADVPTPPGDQDLRRAHQLQQLLKGLGQARADGRVEFQALVFEWLGASATGDAAYGELLPRFNSCRSKMS